MQDNKINIIDKNGDRQGYWEIVFDKLRYTAIYKNNIFNGPWECYFENGLLRTKGVMRHDIQIGFWVWWSKDNTIEETKFYAR